MNHLKRHISKPLDSILSGAFQTPAKIMKALDRQSLHPYPVMLRHRHPYVRKSIASSGYNIVSISRRHRYLLLTVDQRSEMKLAWTYRELSRNQCQFSFPGTISLTQRSALLGEALGRLVDNPAILLPLTIEAFEDDREGWTTVRVDPQWKPF